MMRGSNETSENQTPAQEGGPARGQSLHAPRRDRSRTKDEGGMIEPPLSEREQIEILFKEYNILRTEIMQRTTSADQIYGVAGSAVVAIAVISSAYSPSVGLILFIILPLIIWLTHRNIQFDINNLGARLGELEKAINDRARVTLLEWEKKHGGAWPEAQQRRREYIFDPFLRGYQRCKILLRRRSN
jgi:hypothetical protein